MRIIYVILLFLTPTMGIAQNHTDTGAEFPGGSSALMKFIKEHCRNPLFPKDDDCKVYLSWVVKADGKIEEVTVEKGCSDKLDAEALRVIRMMPNWIPGTIDGEPVEMRVRMPVVFLAPTRKEWRQKMKN